MSQHEDGYPGEERDGKVWQQRGYRSGRERESKQVQAARLKKKNVMAGLSCHWEWRDEGVGQNQALARSTDGTEGPPSPKLSLLFFPQSEVSMHAYFTEIHC